VQSSAFRARIRLLGRYCELVPLARAHREGLHAAAADPDAFPFLRMPPGPGLAEIDRMIDYQLRQRRRGEDLPFTTRLAESHRIVGMTRFLRIDRDSESVEIGGTWLDPALRRTPINTETKYLLLRHAFESEGAHRVQFQTDLRNETSQRAIERIGARREGVLREDVLLYDGYRRSSVYYSVLAEEWSSRKGHLEAMLARPWPPPATEGGSGAAASP